MLPRATAKIGNEMSQTHLDRLPDQIRVDLPIGGRAIVASDLFLSDVPNPSSEAAAASIAAALRAVEGSGVLVLAGNCFELTPRAGTAPGPTPADPATVEEALAAHPQFCSALRLFLSGEPAGCRWFLNWYDETPRDDMRRMLLAEVNRALARRQGEDEDVEAAVSDESAAA